MFRWFALVVALWSVIQPLRALAHDGYAVPDDLWTHWNWRLAPILIIGCTVYAYGVVTIWTNAGRGRGVRGWQIAAFAGGIGALFLTLVSPLDALSGALFSAHMVQHLLLVAVAPPLLVLSAPFVALLWGLPSNWRRPATGWTHWAWTRQTWTVIRHPAVTWLLHAGAIWLWHIPDFYDSAVANEPLHLLEHLCFFGTAMLYWWILLRMDHGLGVLSVFGMALQSGLLGALMSFSGTAWYQAHEATAPLWGLSALEDQQLAGVIMWIPAGMVYVVAGGILLTAWLRAIEHRVTQREGNLPFPEGETV